MLIGHLIGHLLGQTKAGQLFGATMFLVFAMLLPVGSVIGLSALAWNGIARESTYRHRFGESWKAQFEKDQGSLDSERIKIGAEIVGVAVNGGLGIWFYRMLIPALRGAGFISYSAPRSRRKRKRRRSRSPETSPETSTSSTQLNPITVGSPLAPPKIRRPQSEL